MVAGLTLNIFNAHARRVKMANIAQMVNVLQAMVLTDGEKMLLTPTYYVYLMYTVHHDATLLPSTLAGDGYAFENDSLPAVSASASRDRAGAIHGSLCHIESGSGDGHDSHRVRDHGAQHFREARHGQTGAVPGLRRHCRGWLQGDPTAQVDRRARTQVAAPQPRIRMA
jgi:hypothetical protein